MSFWMLSEASDIVICYALQLCIKANVGMKNPELCVWLPVSNYRISVHFIPLTASKHKQVFTEDVSS